MAYWPLRRDRRGDRGWVRVNQCSRVTVYATPAHWTSSLSLAADNNFSPHCTVIKHTHTHLYSKSETPSLSNASAWSLFPSRVFYPAWFTGPFTYYLVIFTISAITASEFLLRCRTEWRDVLFNSMKKKAHAFQAWTRASCSDRWRLWTQLEELLIQMHDIIHSRRVEREVSKMSLINISYSKPQLFNEG